MTTLSSTLLQTVIIVASLSPSLGAQLRTNWRVQYNTARTCQTGTVVATVQAPSSTQGKAPTTVAFRVAKGQGSAPYYAKTGRVRANGQAKVALPVKEAFAPSKGKASSLSCTLHVGTKIQTVACPTLPKCQPATRSRTSSPTHIDTLAPTESPTHMDTLAPTESPTHVDTLAPTESPTHVDTLAPTESPTSASTDDLESLAYDVKMETGPVAETPVCLDGYVTVTVSHMGRPVRGAALDLLVVGIYNHRASGTTDATGKATLAITLQPEDVIFQRYSASLAVGNPKYPSGYQKYNPVLKIDCPNY